MSLQLQYKKLKYEIKYLELEQTETEETFRECITDFEKAFREQVGPEFTDPNKGKGVTLNKKIKHKKLPNDKEELAKYKEESTSMSAKFFEFFGGDVGEAYIKQKMTPILQEIQQREAEILELFQMLRPI